MKISISFGTEVEKLIGRKAKLRYRMKDLMRGWLSKCTPLACQVLICLSYRLLSSDSISISFSMIDMRFCDTL